MAVTAVTIQNSLGVKGFHEIPTDVIALPDRGGGHRQSPGRQDRHRLASSAIIETVAGSWRDLGLAGTVPFVVDPVCASMHGDPLLHPRRWTPCVFRGCFRWPVRLVTPNLDEVRLLVGIDVVDDATQRDAGPCTRWVRGGPWSGWPPARRVEHSPDLLYDGTEFHEYDAPASTPCTTTALATPWARPPHALAHGYPMPDAVAFGKAWVTDDA